MHHVLILGAGKIGALISGLLAESGSYKVQLADVAGTAAEGVVRAHGTGNLAPFALDATDAGALSHHLAAHPVEAVISSLPYYCNLTVAEAARKAHAHYFDLTEDVAVTRSVRAIAAGAAQAFVPQCGLAPGFISIAAAELITHFDTLRAVKMRVGALPQHPNNVLKYSLTWSTEGLINEYGNPCQAVSDGRLMDVAPLEGLEEIEIDGTLYEAFNTSGGLGSLAETQGAHLESMNYKTIRYPGHCEQMRLLMNDLERIQSHGHLRRVEPRNHSSHVHDRQCAKKNFHRPVKPNRPAKRLLVDYEDEDERQGKSQGHARKIGQKSKQACFHENQLANLPGGRAKEAKEAKLAAAVNHQS